MNNPLRELTNEENPGLALTMHLLKNSDYKGDPITNENNLFLHLIPDNKDGVKDYAKYMAEQVVPISVSNYLQGKKKGSEISTPERLSGIRQAPEFITNPEQAEKKEQKRNTKKAKTAERKNKYIKAQYED